MDEVGVLGLPTCTKCELEIEADREERRPCLSCATAMDKAVVLKVIVDRFPSCHGAWLGLLKKAIENGGGDLFATGMGDRHGDGVKRSVAIQTEQEITEEAENWRQWWENQPAFTTNRCPTTSTPAEPSTLQPDYLEGLPPSALFPRAPPTPSIGRLGGRGDSR